MTDTTETTTTSTKSTGKSSRRKRLWTIVAIVCVIILVIPGIIFAVAYVRSDIPEPGEVSTAQVSRIYANDSSTELARIVPPEGNRTFISLGDLPEHVSDSVLAAEDREFWTNRGYSLTGFLRAAVGQVTGDDSAGGGSTITQQYVKNVIVGDDQTYTRKFKELVHAIKMTNEWEKEEILEAYLNTVYFGRNAYGIEAASTAYFNKPAAELTVEESAVLAATIQVPSQLDPWTNREASENRWNYVLDGLVEMELLDSAERQAMQFPEVRDPAEYSAYTEATGPNGHIKQKVMEELETLGISEEDVTTRGLQITTTIDSRVQNAVVNSVESSLAQLQDDARSGVVSIDPHNGAVRAYYGGDEASGWDYASAGLQTGSTFKIFGLAAALQQGIPLTANYSAAPVTLPGNIEVTNWDGQGCGVCSIATALKHSYNTSFIRLQDDLVNKMQDTADMAHALGVARSFPGVDETLREGGGTPYEGIVLGQYQSRVIDMATAVATLTNRGVYNPTHFVEKVETGRGDVLYERSDDKAERRVSQTVADNVAQAMQPIAGYSNKMLANGRPSIAKTGTAQLGDTGLNKDAWMVGGTPELSVAVWVGTADNTSAIFNQWGGNMYGSGSPGEIWKNTLDRALEGREQSTFPQASPVNWRTNAGSGSSELIEPYIPPTPSGPSSTGGGAASQPATPNTGNDTPDEADPTTEDAPSDEPDAPEGGNNGGRPGGGPAPDDQPRPGGDPPSDPGEVIEDVINEQLENLR